MENASAYDNGLRGFHVIAYSAFSSLLLLANAVFLRALDAPSLLLFFQCSSSVVFVKCLMISRSTKEVHWLSDDGLRTFSVGVVSFIFTLFTNLKIIQYVRVQTFVCLRLTAPLVLSFLEYFFAKQELPSLRSLASMVGVASSYFIYAWYNYGKGSPHKYWLVLWYGGALFHSVYVKHVTTRIESSTWNLTFHQNLLAAPFFALMVAFTEMPQTLELFAKSGRPWFALIISCPLGLAMSYYSFHYRKLLTSTSFSMIGVWKVLPIFAIALVLPQYALWTGTVHDTVLVFVCIGFCSGYSTAGKRGTSSPDPAVVAHCRKWLLPTLLILGLIVTSCWHSATYTPSEFYKDFSNDRIMASKANSDSLNADSTSSSTNLTSNIKLCDHFTPVSDIDSGATKLSKEDTVMNTGLIGQLSVKGRLGNRIDMLTNMIKLAERGCCNIEINEYPILKGWIPRTRVFKNLNQTCSTACENSSCSWACPHFNGQQWYYRRDDGDESRCALEVLKYYFDINSTHALGRACPSTPHVALHVRSGDVAAGHFSGITGSYISNKVHGSYFLAPTAYYLAALRDMQSRQPGVKAFVFCETMDNPTCDFFAKLGRILPGIELRVGESFNEDLFLLLCANEACTSTGSFKDIFMLSGREPLLHAFSSSEVNSCKTDEKNSFLYFLEEEDLRERFNRDVVTGWHNTGYQRSAINQDYAVKSISCNQSHG